MGGKLGQGGMGEVHVARDTVLGRDVAIKRARRPQDALRLLREAQVTAGLEHPGIVPVYEAGIGADGAPYYAMRLLQGQSLHDAIRRASTKPARVALVRRLIDVAEAMAFAHARGVVHLDLKPANVMVGPFGETLVSDWGLAAHTSSHPEGGGTEGFMAPEQALGGPVDARADVFAVGAMLQAIYAHDPDPPPELQAVVRRATAPARDDRYPDMAQLAADLNAWFEGRRVSAHAYSRRELVRRFLRAWRAPLAVGAVSLLTLTVTLAAGWWRTAADRERAVLAEAAAVQSEGAANDHLETALRAQMRVALRDGLEVQAAVLAAHAMALSPSPEARGVLARLLDRPALRLVHRTPMPPCVHRAISPSGRLVACSGPAGMQVVDLDAGTTRTLNDPMVWMAFAGDEGAMLLASPDERLWWWAPPEAPRPLSLHLEQIFHLENGRADGVIPYVVSEGTGLLDAPHERRTLLHECLEPAARATAAALLDDARLAVVCSDGALLEHGTDTRLIHQLDATRAAPRVLARGPGADLVVGTPAGEVILWAGGAERRWELNAPVATIALSARHVAVVTEDGVLHLLPRGPDDHGPVARLRLGDARLVWLQGGARLRVFGDDITDWDLPATTEPDGWRFEAGLATLAVGTAPWLAAGLGTGAIEVVHIPDGAPIRTLSWGASAIKDIATSPAGDMLGVAAIGAVEPVFRTDTWEVITQRPDGPHRRMGWLSDSTLVGARYSGGVTRLDPGGLGRLTDLSLAQVADLEAQGQDVAALDIFSGVWRLGTTSVPLGTVGEANATAPLGSDTLVAAPGVLLRLDPGGEVVQRTPFDGTAVELTVSSDLRWAALGLLDGTALVIRVADGELVAKLLAHTGRVSALVFADHDRWLYTGAWDATARRWSTRAFEADPDALRAEVNDRWGLELDEVLSDAR